MDDGLDGLLAQLRVQPLDRGLGAFEGDVRRRLARNAQSVGLSFASARAAAIGLALVLGTGIGGFTAAAAMAPPQPSLFAASNALAPSTLLDGHR